VSSKVGVNKVDDISCFTLEMESIEYKANANVAVIFVERNKERNFAGKGNTQPAINNNVNISSFSLV